MANWKMRFEQALKRGHFTRADHRLSGAWQSCAVGENAGRRVASRVDEEFMFGGGGDFSTLVELGLEFAGVVEDYHSQSRAYRFHDIKAGVARAKRIHKAVQKELNKLEKQGVI